MKVYVAIHGIYEQTYPSAVYASLQLAIGAEHRPGDVWTETEHRSADDTEERYKHLYGPPTKSWTNGKDWDNHVAIEVFDLVDSGPARSPDIRVRTTEYDGKVHADPVEGPWEHVGETPTALRGAADKLEGAMG
jgi:hypothetical protein